MTDLTSEEEASLMPDYKNYLANNERDKLSTLTKRKYKAMAKAILTQAGADYVE